jgi:hypothetical protein
MGVQSLNPVLLAGAACIGMALLATDAQAKIELNPQGWKFPNIITSEKVHIRPADETQLIPGKETLVKVYRRMNGTYFMTYEIEGRVFGVQIDTDGKMPFEYGIMDTDGDGKFESKIVFEKGNTDKGYVPQWVIDYYYSRHPELKNPSPAMKAVPPSLTTAPPPAATPTPTPGPALPPSPEVLGQPNP